MIVFCRDFFFPSKKGAGLVVPVDCGGAGLLPAQLRVPVLGRVLVVVTELGLRQQRAQLLRLFRAHAQVAVVEVLLDVHEEDVPGGQEGE